MHCIHRKEMSNFTLSSGTNTQFIRNMFNGLIQTIHHNPRRINFFPIEVYDESSDIQDVLDGRQSQFPASTAPYLVYGMRDLHKKRPKNV